MDHEQVFWLVVIGLGYYVVGTVLVALLNAFMRGYARLLHGLLEPAPAVPGPRGARDTRRELKRPLRLTGRPRLPSLRIVRAGPDEPRRREQPVPFDPRFLAYSRTPSHPALARVLAALRPRLNALLELLPRSRPRSLELVGSELVLVSSACEVPSAVRTQPLDELGRAIELAHEESDLALRPRASGARCAYCHDDLAEGWACPGCRTLLHAACRDELARCPTPGCRELSGRRQAA